MNFRDAIIEALPEYKRVLTKYTSAEEAEALTTSLEISIKNPELTREDIQGSFGAALLNTAMIHKMNPITSARMMQELAHARAEAEKALK